MRIATIVLVALTATTSASFFYRAPVFAYQPRSWVSWVDSLDQHFESLHNALHTLTSPSAGVSSWTTSPDAYSTSVKLNGIEPASLTAALSAGGKSLSLSGKRQVEGCTCGATAIGSVDLPYTPKPEDVKLTYKEEGQTLEVRLARHAKPDKEHALSIAFKTSDTSNDHTKATPESTTGAADENKPIHFIPHESAGSGERHAKEEGKLDTDTSEKSLMAKFRGAAAFAAAGPASSTSESDAAEDSAQVEAREPSQPHPTMEARAATHK